MRAEGGGVAGSGGRAENQGSRSKTLQCAHRSTSKYWLNLYPRSPFTFTGASFALQGSNMRDEARGSVGWLWQTSGWLKAS